MRRSDLPCDEQRRFLVICLRVLFYRTLQSASASVSVLFAARSAAAAFWLVVPCSAVAACSALVSRQLQLLTGSRPSAWETVHALPDRPVLGRSGEPASPVVNPRLAPRLGSGWALPDQEKPHDRASAEHGTLPQHAGLPRRAVSQPHSPAQGGRPRSLDRHGPEPEPFVRLVLGLINPSNDQLTIKGREVRTARPPRIRPRVTGQHPGHMRRLRHAHVIRTRPIQVSPLSRFCTTAIV